ncbi:RNA polymerase III transcription factor IIIC subunit-domain-containing protein [Paraphoma chrysanthemicola]|uniref:RNA polymerase III transcription factor IIIC subunit-domain-containing protein n=1 Tax=Paraphoma chrysanthemicola TaxID=798071 RepID=A0A8K0VUX4_9PLEO|nr:RNA polymerase III transcription factor IIIC subunit-domain-containing protein [Paraphoma chrysanthemicola]
MNSDHDANGAAGEEQHAPWLPIPSRAISVVEHPCIIKNIDKGITSLGGPVKLSKGLRSKVEADDDGGEDDQFKQLLSVSLRPDDPFAKRLLSTAVTTNNLLLKVTVPKRTGRKRKRGSNGPFVAAEANDASTTGALKHNYVDAAAIYRSLQDNESTYKVALAGILDETHRFRTMPDLQYAAARNDTMVDIRDHIMPMRYSELKNYHVNTTAGPNFAKSVGPSAEFIQTPVAFNYRFQQNVYVKYTDEGVVNLQKSLAYNSYTIIKPTDAEVPSGPKPNLPAESSLTPYLQTLIAQIRAELEDRPIITRHLLYNKLGWDRRTRLRQAAVYCGYFFESGPWREALVRWGVDPRKDPSFRKYQTVSFTSYQKSGRAKHGKTFDEHVQKLGQMSAKDLESQHMFDGKTVSDTGNTFQFCDITDPLIAKILATDDIRTNCAPTFQGWYHVGTWAKVTVILKDKMNTIIAGKEIDDAIYSRVVGWPELWDDKEMAATYKAEVDHRQTHKEKQREHDVMHSVRWAARNPRYAFEKMEAMDKEQQDTRDEEGRMEEDAEDAEVPEDMTEIPDTAETILREGDDEGGDVDDSNEDDENDESNRQAVVDEVGELEEEDDSDDEDLPIASARAASEGPAPFGGLYRV